MNTSCPILPRAKASRRTAFTLLELLVVISIVGMVAALVAPGLGSGQAARASNAIWEIADTITQARSYAMTKNTYVYLGVGEYDSSQAVSGSQKNGIGRIGLFAVTSKTGSRLATLDSSSSLAISKLVMMDGVATAASAPTLPNMESLATLGGTNIQPVSGTALISPLSGPPRASMGTVIEFDPRGSARIWTGAAPSRAITSPLELVLLPAKGNLAMDPSTAAGKNFAVVRINAFTGAPTIFRP